MHTPSFIEQYPNAIPNELCDKLIGLADNTLKTYPQPYKNISETYKIIPKTNVVQAIISKFLT